MKHILILLLSFTSTCYFSQNYLLNGTTNGTTVSGCSGNFYDNGGAGLNAAGSYANNANWTITFCPSAAGSKVNLLFTDFDVENGWDFMYIYDGANTSAPSLGVYSGAVTPIGNVQATATNTSGCITIRFTSDGSFTYGGWRAVISCVTPCETINSVFNGSTPAAGAGGIIRVCQGASVTFNGSGTFSSGSSTGATYSWNFNNGLTGSGQTATTTYTAPGVYVVNLNINKAGCINYNKINQIVHVSTTPSFSATTTSTNSICLGQSATLIGSVTPTPFVTNCTPPIAGVTPLPDGIGVSYQTCITVDCFGSSQIVNSATDIANICINMEHSYLGDLQMEIVCPNGQTVPLKTYAQGGGGTYLGNALDDGTTNPGTGANYCFSMSGTALLVNGPTVISGNPAGASIAAGTYSPASSFAGLVGCPLNGGWCIKITDNLAIDNGTIFSWDVNFSTAVPASQSFTPSIVSQTWSGASITSTVGNNAVITPTSTGTKCYTLTAVDNFGCSYTTVQCVTVTPGSYAGVSNTLAVCNSAASTNLFSLLGTGVATTGSWSGPAPALSGGNLGTFNPAGLTAGAYNYTYTVPASGSCPPSTAIVSVTVRPNPSATLTFTNPTCANPTGGIININNTSSPLPPPAQTISSFASSLGTVTGQTVTGLGVGTPVITLTNNFGCTFTVSPPALTITPGPTAFSLTPANTTCGNNNGTLTFGAPITGGTAPYTYSVNGAAATSVTSSLSIGTYSVTIKDLNGCLLTQTTSIINIPGPTAIAGTTTQASCTSSNGTFSVTGVTGGTAAYTYSVDGVGTSSLTSGLAAGTHTILVRDANGCIFSRTFVIGTASGPSSFVVNTTNSNCGLANGTSTVSGVVGGTPTYSFSFDGGAFGTGTTSSGLTAGNHTVVVKDINACTLTVTYSVSNNAPPTAAISSSLNVLCNGASTGSLTVVPTGGTSPYTYTLTSPTQTNTTGAFTSLPAGTYSITVKDNFACTATVTAVISQPTLLTGTVSSVPVNCFGNATGSVSASGSGGLAPYTYLWPTLGNSTLSTVGGVTAGTYTVTIRDANLCSITRTITVTEPASLTLTSTLTPATCSLPNGSGTVTVGGGTTNYSYNWSNGGVTNILTAASAGTYTLTVQDFNGCVLTRTVAITNIAGPTAITGTTTLAGCGLSNGTYNITGVTGGTAAYTYSIDGVGTSSLTTGLSAGTHTILVSDNNNCTFSTTFNINTANGPTSAPVVTTNASCGTANGTATVTTVTGGVPAYQYSFDGGAFGLGNTISGLASGTHTVIIRDVNSCTLAVTYNLLNNSGPALSVTNSLNINCFGGNTGSLTVTPVGGTAPYTFTLTAPTVTNTTGSFTGLVAGAYNIIVSDNSGCTATTSVTLTQPSAVTLTVISLPVSCFGSSTGTVSASGSGGSGTLTYLWPALGSSTLATINNVAAGTYTVTQTDGNGCSISQSITVTQPTSLTLTSTLTPATCGNSNGSGTVTVSGGTPAYSYSWSNGGISSTLISASAGTYTINVTDFSGCVLTRTLAITDIAGPTAITGTTTLAGCGLSNGTYSITGITGGTAPFTFNVDGVATSSITSGLSAGTHSVAVIDFNGCTFSTTFIIGTTVGPTNATVVTTNATCGNANGTATVTAVTGGVTAYQYSFDGGAFVNGSSISSLSAGPHFVTIQDANSCTVTVTYSVLNNGSPTAAIISSTNTSCFAGTNGGFTIAGAGGSGAPFTYTLTSPFQTNGTGVFIGLPANTYTIITSDDANCATTTTVAITQPPVVTLTTTSLPALCFGTATGTINITGAGGTGAYTYSLNGASSQTSSSYTSVGFGIYNIAIKDANGCTATQTVQVNQPSALAIVVSTQNANCTAANGIASATVSGGTPIYTYTWTGGGGAAAVSNPMVSGAYTVTATDNNGCVISSPAVIGLTTGGTAAITASSNITCNGYNNGSLTIGMTGGAAPFTYLWSPSSQTVATATSLSPGTYSCIVTDFYGCIATATATIIQPNVLNITTSSNNVKCFGGSTGTITAAGSGGTGSYNYLWPTLASTLSTVPNVSIGNYTCVITDGNGCTISQTIAVTEPTAISLTSSVTSANCNQANGCATITATGGAPGAYTYTWSSGSNTAVQCGVSAGTQTIIVQDANNCIQTLAVTIPNIAGPIISISSQTNVSCFGGNNGVATTSVSGGVGPYTYSWGNGSSNAIATNLSSNIYTVSATDQAGCVTSTFVTISQPSVLTVTILPTNPKCFGATNGFGIAAALGGTPSYTYSWSDGGTGPTSNQLGANNYNLTVTDANGCIVTSSMALVNPPALAASITATNVSCFGACNGIATATSTNAIGGVTYFWIGGSNPITSQTATALCAGTYTMFATDQNTCTASSQVTITEPPVFTASISSTGSITCNGGNNGSAVVSATGGTPTYSYTWSGTASANGNSANANSLVAGSYTVTITDALGCLTTANTNILQPTPFVPILTFTDPKCNGALDGTANIAYSGGAGTTTFLWEPGLQQPGNSVNNLGAGSQSVTITSNGTCTTSLTFTLSQPALLTAAVSATNSTCNQSNGQACAVVGGGTSPLTYQWSNGPTTLCNNNIPSGSYNFVVTDFNGCTANGVGLVSDISGPVVSITSHTDVSCFGGSNGAATAIISGGVPTYTVFWSNGATTQNVSNLNVGIKSITVIDASGCIGTASVTILQPSILTSAIGSFTNVSCSGLSDGGATIFVNGGTSPYTYSWTPSAQTNSVMLNVPANSYSCLVTDNNGCTTSSSVSIFEPQPLQISNFTVTDISCFGGSNGQISTTLVGGTPGYTYTWIPSQPGNNGTIGGLPAGGYSLTVIDSHACPVNTSFNLIQPTQLVSSYTSSPASCGAANGSATITVTGGTPTYTVNWNTFPTQQGFAASNIPAGTNWIASITDSKGCLLNQSVTVSNALPLSITGFNITTPSCFGLSNGAISVNYASGSAPYTVSWSNPISQTTTSSALTQSVSGVASGSYTATLTDGNGCSVSSSTVVTQPPNLVLLSSPNSSICFGNITQLSASASGGSGAYSYTWSPNIGIGAGPHTVNPIGMTIYSVSASDGNGCLTNPKIITINVTPPLSVIGSSATTCHSVTTIFTPTITSPGNGGPYNYTWSPIVGSLSSLMVAGNALNIATTNTYVVVVDDGCSVPATAIFTLNTNPAPAVTFTANMVEACAPAVIDFTATPGSPGGYTYYWLSDNKDFMGNTNPISYNYLNTDTTSVTLTITNTLTGCSSSLTQTNYIIINKQPIASFYADPQTVNILDPNFNFINTSQGATSYYWHFGDPSANNGSNTSIVTNPSHAYAYAGTYDVNLVASTIKGCKDTAMLMVEVTPDFSLYIPNTFTPDGNGLNDVFQPIGVGIDEENYRMDIYDRWGETIFTSDVFQKGWDGSVKGVSKMATQGVYTYRIMVVDLQGGKHPYVGHVTVILKDN